MPKLKKKTIATSWPLILTGAAGNSISNFFALAESTEFNEEFESENPPTYQSPTSYYTHIVHYVDFIKKEIYRIPDSIETIWMSANSKNVLAAGFPRGLYSVDNEGVKEIVLKEHEGVFSGLWGNENNLFACGWGPFVLNRKEGKWSYLSLPPNTEEYIHNISAIDEKEIYLIGGNGAILFFDGNNFQKLQSPTTVHLHSIVPLDNKYMCIGGINGILMLGNKNGWRIVPTNDDVPIRSLAKFKEKVFFATSNGIFSFDGRKEPILEIDMSADIVIGLNDGLLIRDADDSWICDGENIIKLDTLLRMDDNDITITK